MKLFVFGLGYTAGHFVRDRRSAFDAVASTVRTAEKAAQCGDDGIEALVFDGDPSGTRGGAATDGVSRAIEGRLAQAETLLVSVQPGKAADPVLATFGSAVATSPTIRSIVYLSTIGVYGDHDGAWIDESAATAAANARQAARIEAEHGWLALGADTGKRVTVLRLAGIYGPGRNALHDLQHGEARRIDKPGQVFNRIHVADIGRAIAAAFDHPGPDHPASGRIYNVTDDEPAPAPDVVAYAATLMGLPPPPLIPFAEADMSPMARTFYSANRRVSNAALRSQLGVDLAFPTYRSGLDALWAAGEGRT